jgi:hypothetical protein
MADKTPEIDWAVAVEELYGPGAQFGSADTYEELARTWAWKHQPKQEGVPEERRPLPTREALIEAHDRWLAKQTTQQERQEQKARLKTPENLALLREEIEDATNTSQLKAVLLKVLDLIEAL